MKNITLKTDFEKQMFSFNLNGFLIRKVNYERKRNLVNQEFYSFFNEAN